MSNPRLMKLVKYALSITPAKDLRLIVLATIICILFVLIPSLSNTPIRIILGIPLVLFFPGYSLIATLFPRKNDLDGIERFALSLGLSIAITPLLGLALNYTPLGIRTIPVLITLSGFIIGVSILACIRRFALPEEEIFSAHFRFRGIYKLAKNKLFEESSNTKIGQDRLLKITSCISFVFVTLALILIARNSPATGYELSIYASLPSLTWIFLISALAFGICIIVCEAFSGCRSKFWLVGFFIILLVNFIILSLQVFRGYYGYGLADSLGHLKLANSIVSTGFIFEDDFYPVSHILWVVLTEICAVSLVTVLKYLSVIFTVLFMLFTYLLASVVSSKKEHAILAAAASSPLLFSYYHLTPYPHALSLLTFPLMFYLYFKSLNMPSFSNKMALVILILLFPFFHPVPEMVLISCLVIAEVAKLGWERRMHYSYRMENISMNPALISFTTFFLWISYFTFLGSTTKRVFSWISGETFSVVARASELKPIFELGPWEFFKLLLKMYGHNLIFIVLSLIASGMIIRYFLQRRNEVKNFFILSLLFLTSSLIYIIICMSLSLVSWGRILGANVGMWATPVLASFGLYELFRSPKIPKKAGIAVVVIILFSASAIGVFSAYHSPWIQQPNLQVTYMYISGSEWLNTYKNPEIGISPMNLRAGGYQWQWVDIPDHFGYPEHGMLGELLERDTLITLAKSFKLVAGNPILSKSPLIASKAATVSGFNESDFDNLEQDASVDKLYSNGEFDILLGKRLQVNNFQVYNR